MISLCEWMTKKEAFKPELVRRTFNCFILIFSIQIKTRKENLMSNKYTFLHLEYAESIYMIYFIELF